MDNNISSENDKAKYYLEYIDKEMTFTGIITSINLGGLIFIADRILLKSSTLSDNVSPPVLLFAGLILLIVSAYLFLSHRSDLAFYYGQICLSMYSPKFTNRPIHYWFDILDNWNFWNIYFFGIGCLYTGFCSLCIVFFIVTMPKCPFSIIILHNQWWACLILITGGALIRIVTLINKHNADPNNPLPSNPKYPV